MDSRTVLLTLLSERTAGNIIAVGYLLVVVVVALEVRDRRRRR
jgi:hypothetical protein